MAKDWEKVNIVVRDGKAALEVADNSSKNVSEAPARRNKFDKTKKLSFEDLKKEGEELALKKSIYEADLLSALDKGVLKSKKAIKEATALKKKKEKNSKKQVEKERRDKIVNMATAVN